jgi:hypothetical protein
MARTRRGLVVATSLGALVFVVGAVVLLRTRNGDSAPPAIARGPTLPRVTNGDPAPDVLEAPKREPATGRHDDAPKDAGPEIVLDEATLVARHRAQWDAQTARASLPELRAMHDALEREIDERSRPKLQAMIESGDSQLITPDVSVPYHDAIDETELTMRQTDVATGLRRAVLPRKGNMDLYLLKAKSAWIAGVIDQRAVLDTDPK